VRPARASSRCGGRGADDDFLIKGEKRRTPAACANWELVSGDDDGLGELMRAVGSGEFKGSTLAETSERTCSICSTRSAPGRLAAILGRLELLIVQTLTLDPTP